MRAGAARVTHLQDAAPQPWRNGGGLTRELFAWPSAAGWAVRLSVAEVSTDGPFSTFPGVQRWFCVLQGDGVELRVDGARHLLRPGDAPFSFDGEATVECRLPGGPTRDLNLMLRGRRGALLAVQPGQAWTPPSAPWGLFATGAGRVMAMQSPEDAGRAAALPALKAAGALAVKTLARCAVCFQPESPRTAAWWWFAGPEEAPS